MRRTRFRIACPLVEDGLTDDGELDWLTSGTVEDLVSIMNVVNDNKSDNEKHLHTGMGTSCVWKAVVMADTSMSCDTVLSASM